MLLRPERSLQILGKMGSTTFINFAEHIPRFIGGAALYMAAPASKTPTLFLWAGGFIALTSVIILIIPRRWHHAYAQYWARRIPEWAVRAISPLAMVAGLGVTWSLWG